MSKIISYNHGFSILELLCAIMLASIIASIVINNFNKLKSSYSQNELNDLNKIILIAKNQAQKLNNQIEIEFHNNSNEITISLNKEIFYRKKFNNIKIISTKFSGFENSNILKIYPNGIYSTGTVHLKTKKTNCAFIISLRGNTRLSCI